MAAFDRAADAALAVSQIIAAGIQPAALEICDRRMVEICEAHLPSGYPREREAILFAELAMFYLGGAKDEAEQHS